MPANPELKEDMELRTPALALGTAVALAGQGQSMLTPFPGAETHSIPISFSHLSIIPLRSIRQCNSSPVPGKAIS